MEIAIININEKHSSETTFDATLESTTQSSCDNLKQLSVDLGNLNYILVNYPIFAAQNRGYLIDMLEILVDRVSKEVAKTNDLIEEFGCNEMNFYQRHNLSK